MGYWVFGDIGAHGVELVARDLVGVLVLGEHARHHDGVGAVVEPQLGQAAEEFVPVDVAVADLEVLMHPHRVAGRVGDVTQAMA